MVIQLLIIISFNKLFFILDKENTTLCSQLLLHPPFKPKRLIHVYPDGSIQVLSTIDEQSNENQEQFRLDYSNSASTSLIKQNPILPSNFFQIIVFGSIVLFFLLR